MPDSRGEPDVQGDSRESVLEKLLPGPLEAVSRLENMVSAIELKHCIEQLPLFTNVMMKHESSSSPLGWRIKQLRQEKDLTLEQLAKLSSVSKSMISKVERQEAVPTTTVLSRLAEAFGISISGLIGATPSGEALVIRQADQPVFRDPRNGFERHSLSPLFPSRGVDLVLNILPPHQSTGAFQAHPAGVEEHLAVTEGTLHLRLGANTFTLEKGDAMFFHANVEHEFINLGDEPCRYFIAIDGSRLR